VPLLELAADAVGAGHLSPPHQSLRVAGRKCRDDGQESASAALGVGEVPGVVDRRLDPFHAVLDTGAAHEIRLAVGVAVHG
jgi:hypothetical protein